VITQFEEGLEPSPQDELWTLAQKIALILYAAFGAGQPAPDPGDDFQPLAYKVAAYLYQGSLTPVAGGGVTAGGGAGDAYEFLAGKLKLWNDTQGIYQTVSLTGAPGHEQIVIST